MSDIDLKARREAASKEISLAKSVFRPAYTQIHGNDLIRMLDRLESAELRYQRAEQVAVGLSARCAALERRAEEAESALAAKPKPGWQARCLERGFEYVREPDDHYVLADVPEMAGLLAELLGVEVRSKENESYGQTVRELRDELDAAIDAHMRAYEAEKERDALRVGQSVGQGEVLVTVAGLTGSGKSAVCGEIEILCKALGLGVSWEGGQAEKNMTHADWTQALDLYRPRVRIIEVNVPRAMAQEGGK